MKVCIVVPTIRENSIRKFLNEWRTEFSTYDIIVIEDNPERSFDLNSAGLNIHHYAWSDIDKELGDDSWVIPRRSDCIRSYGFLKASQLSPNAIITIDDDCYPSTPQYVDTHVKMLYSDANSDAWISTGDGGKPRGMPYQSEKRVGPTGINHGLWSKVPDFDAVTQLSATRHGLEFVPRDLVIPRSRFFPMCGMNLSFKPELLPAMYFLLMGKNWPFDRFGDIWCGIFAKRICDHLGYYVKSGNPLVEHQRASDVWTNLRKELPGYEVNEQLWSDVDKIVLTGTTVRTCYKELARSLPLKGEYWTELKRAMQIWSDLFSD